MRPDTVPDSFISPAAGHEMAWKVVGNHVCPVNDLREHVLDDCWCRPVDEDGVVVHNSLDRRELYERGVRKPV